MKNAKEIGNWAGEGGAYGNLGIVYGSLIDYRKAIEYAEKSLKIGKELDEGGGYGNLANACRLLGDYQKAVEYHKKSLKIAVEIGDQAGEGRAYGNLGIAYESLPVE